MALSGRDRIPTLAAPRRRAGPGTVDRAARLIRSYVVGGAFSDPSEMRNLVWDLESHDVQVIMAPGVTDVSSERIRVRPVAGLPLLHLDRPRHQDALRWAKRTFDLVGTALILVAVSPLLAFAAWKIKRYDGGRLHLYYVDNWSMIQDIVILTRTVGAVLSSRGAY